MNKKIVKRILGLVLTTSILSTMNFKPTFAATQISRIGGLNRYETSALISKEGWSQSSEYAVIASGDDFPDALCAVPLAKKYNSPILLTSKNNLDTSIELELERLNISKVILIGGYNAISSTVEDKIKNLGINNIERINGINRYETSVLIAQRLGNSNSIVLVNGSGFADALSIATIAAKKNMPILLTNKEALPSEISNYLAEKNLSQSYVIGGTGAVSASTFSNLVNPIRIWGENRFATNKNILNYFQNDLSFDKIYISIGDGPNGNEFADALSGAALAANSQSGNVAPILLMYKSLTKESGDYIVQKMTNQTQLIALGGEAAVPTSAINKLLTPNNLDEALYNKILQGLNTVYSMSNKNNIKNLSKNIIECSINIKNNPYYDYEYDRQVVKNMYDTMPSSDKDEFVYLIFSNIEYNTLMEIKKLFNI